MLISYFANATFLQVHRDPNPYLFVRGPVGSGKSSGCIMHLFMNAMNQDPDDNGVRKTRFAVLRSTYPALKSTVVKSWIDWFGDHIKIVYDVPIRGTIEMPLVDGTKLDIEIFFIALDREDNVNKLQSLELTGAHINEAAEIPKGVFDMLKTRVKRFPPPNVGGPTKSVIVLDYNSVDINHWLYILAEKDKPPKHSFYVQPSALIHDGQRYRVNPNADNLGHWQDGDPKRPPVKTATWFAEKKQWWVPHLDPEYYLDMVAGNDEDFINVYILNNYGSIRKGRPVYKAYSDKDHASERVLKPLDGVPLVIGMDCGLDPAAAFCQLSPLGQMITLDELVTENTSIQEFVYDILWPLIRNKYKKFNFEIKVDPAAVNRSQNDKRSALDIIKLAGLPVSIARTNEPLARREAINFFLRKRGGFLLSGPTTPILREGFISEYKYAKVSQAQAFNIRFKEKPEKNLHSHIHDALQYAGLELSEGRTIRRTKSKHRQRYTSPADSVSGY